MTNQRRAAPYRLVACALMGLAVSWPSAAQELLFHFPLDGSAAVQGSTAGDARLYVLDDGPPPATVPGKFGNALYFSGNAAIAMPFELDPVAYPLVTVTAWVKVDSESTGERVVFSAGNGNVPRLSVYGDRAYFIAARGALMYESAMPRDEWVFVAGVIDVGNARMATHQGEGHLVAEGINVSNLYGPSGYRNPDDPSVPFGPYVFVGSHGFGQWRANRMAIDEVRVYSGVLSVDQIGALGGAAPRVTYETTAPRTISADVEQHTLPGDHFEPKALPGDHFEPKALPGDHFEPKALPGDHFEPKALPGDHFDPELPPGD
jgi:hypothetical protein